MCMHTPELEIVVSWSERENLRNYQRASYSHTHSKIKDFEDEQWNNNVMLHTKLVY